MSNRGEVFDIAVIGGGLVGLTLARLFAMGLKQQSLQRSIVVLEPKPPAVSPANMDLRVSAIAPASRTIMQTMGAWSPLPTDRVSSYERMTVWQSAGAAGGERSVTFDAAELGEPNLGHIIENEAMRLAIWDLLFADPAIELLTAAKFSKIVAATDACEIYLETGEVLKARLVIGADGARSRVREQLGAGFREIAHGQSAIVAHVATELPHASTAWQRFLPGGPVALLPLSDGRSSLVWSCPDAQAQSLLQVADNEFAAALQAGMDNVLGAMRVASPRGGFPLVSGHAVSYCGHRFALVGDAAHRIHPLAGQGVNLGLLDAAVLAEALLAHLAHPSADAGDLRVLRRYERSRKGDNLLTLGAMDALNRLFSGSARDLGGIGLAAVGRFQPLRNRFARYAMGQGRELPAAAQLQSR